MIRTIRYTSPDDLQFRERSDNSDVTALVRGILEDVRQNGDAALYAYSRKFDKAELTALEVTQAEIDEAFAAVYGRVRPLCLAYRDEFLPLVDDDERAAEQTRLRAPGARLVNDFVLRLLWERALW